jgi:hypothetical protein
VQFDRDELRKNLESGIRAGNYKALVFMFKELKSSENNLLINEVFSILESLLNQLCRESQLKPLFVLLRSTCEARFNLQDVIEAEMKLAFLRLNLNLLTILLREGFSSFQKSVKHLRSLSNLSESEVSGNQIDELLDHHLIPNGKRRGNLVLILKRAERNGDFDLIRLVILFLRKP